MRKSFLYLPILFAFMLVVISCGKTTTPEPTATENLTKSWSVSVAKEGGTQVYQKGGSTNTVLGYGSYRLSLAAASAVTLTAVDGTSFTGTWSLSSDNKTLTLTNLKNSAGATPTGSNPAGTIVFNVLSAITATTVTLETATTDLKAGGKIVNLQLVNP
jgi:hypothetical protein